MSFSPIRTTPTPVPLAATVETDKLKQLEERVQELAGKVLTLTGEVGTLRGKLKELQRPLPERVWSVLSSFGHSLIGFLKGLFGCGTAAPLVEVDTVPPTPPVEEQDIPGEEESMSVLCDESHNKEQEAIHVTMPQISLDDEQKTALVDLLNVILKRVRSSPNDSLKWLITNPTNLPKLMRVKKPLLQLSPGKLIAFILQEQQLRQSVLEIVRNAYQGNQPALEFIGYLFSGMGSWLTTPEFIQRMKAENGQAVDYGIPQGLMDQWYKEAETLNATKEHLEEIKKACNAGGGIPSPKTPQASQLLWCKLFWIFAYTMLKPNEGPLEWSEVMTGSCVACKQHKELQETFKESFDKAWRAVSAPNAGWQNRTDVVKEPPSDSTELISDSSDPVENVQSELPVEPEAEKALVTHQASLHALIQKIQESNTPLYVTTTQNIDFLKEIAKETQLEDFLNHLFASESKFCTFIPQERWKRPMMWTNLIRIMEHGWGKNPQMENIIRAAYSTFSKK